ncbi:MAG: hypothetical protein QN121_06365 [Armatimonadota bacterium]|nr:hypothetical protein [Armatimonadota bacterium]
METINISRLGTDIVIALSILLVLWYIVGAQVNRRRSIALVRWIRDGIGVFGGTPTIRWLSPTSFRIQVDEADPPFRVLGLLVLLETRELLLLWLFQRALRRRDLLVVRADLYTPPRLEMEIFRPLPGVFRELKRELGRDQVEAHPVGVGDLHVYPVSSLDHIEKARPVFSDLSPFLRRLSLRRKSPHLIVTCTLPVRSTPPARELFEKLREIAGLVR